MRRRRREDLATWDADAEVIRAARDEVLRRARLHGEMAAARARRADRVAELRIAPRRHITAIAIANLEHEMERA